MPIWSNVTRAHVLSAIEEYDRLGQDGFLTTYGFRRSQAYALVYDGRRYDSKAILGAAYRYATGTAARWDEFNGGKGGAAKVLGDLDFDVSVTG